jgi:hypothetical protein
MNERSKRPDIRACDGLKIKHTSTQEANAMVRERAGMYPDETSRTQLTP